jgi:hypothetical protein
MVEAFTADVGSSVDVDLQVAVGLQVAVERQPVADSRVVRLVGSTVARFTAAVVFMAEAADTVGAVMAVDTGKPVRTLI